MVKGMEGENCLEALYPKCLAHRESHLNGEASQCESILTKLVSVLPRLAKTYFK
jgi:hypothetical protein